MKYFLQNILIVSLLPLTACVGTNNSSTEYSDTLTSDEMLAYASSDVSTKERTQIRVPITFDPKTPLTTKLNNTDLNDLVVQKYYNIKNNHKTRKEPISYAAYRRKLNLSQAIKDPEFKYVDVTSNLAKVYFIDDFEGFVRYNSEFYNNIIADLEKELAKEKQRKILEKQKLYE